MGNRRWFLESFLFLSISNSLDNSRSWCGYRLGTFVTKTSKSGAVSYKTWAKVPICSEHFQWASACEQVALRFSALYNLCQESCLLKIVFLTLPTCIKVLWKENGPWNFQEWLSRYLTTFLAWAGPVRGLLLALQERDKWARARRRDVGEDRGLSQQLDTNWNETNSKFIQLGWPHSCVAVE